MGLADGVAIRSGHRGAGLTRSNRAVPSPSASSTGWPNSTLGRIRPDWPRSTSYVARERIAAGLSQRFQLALGLAEALARLDELRSKIEGRSGPFPEDLLAEVRAERQHRLDDVIAAGGQA